MEQFKKNNNHYVFIYGNNFDILNQKIISSVDHIITDPPYNISKKNNLHTLKNKRQGVYFGKWDKQFDVLDWIEPFSKLIKKNGCFIIFCSYLYVSFVIKELEKNGFETKDVVRWVKLNPMPRNINRRYVQDTEYAVWAVRKSSKWIFNNNTKNYLRPEFRTAVVSGKEKTIHPTQKSLKLMNEIIKIHTNKNDLILDPFMGSGTTAISCLMSNRNFIGIEINKKFYNIALSRFKNKL